MRKTTVLGLTGQTGAGKSTVSAIFSERKIPIVDADQVARDVVDNGKQCLADLCLAFTIDILNGDGTLNRQKFADLVFGDKAKLKKLNSIIFPYIIEEIGDTIKQYREAGEPLVVLDAPTLFESGADRFCDLVVSVIAPENERLNRIIVRDRISDTQARTRMKAQHNDAFYTSRSKYVIVNDGYLDTLREKTLDVLDHVRVDGIDLHPAEE